MIGDENQSIELIFNAEGLRLLAVEMNTQAVAEMDALSARETAVHRQPAVNEDLDVGMPEIGNPASWPRSAR